MLRNTNPVFEFRGPWGVPVQIGASIIALPLLIVGFDVTFRSLAYDLMFLTILVGSILLHELGHAWACLVQGVPVKRIVLYGGGGYCESTISASRSQQELIAVMGPIVTIALWAVAGLIAPLISDPEIAWVFWTISSVNGFLALLNLLPLQPLDGGKLFELLMQRLFPSRFAIMVTGAAGLFCAVAWVPLMAYGFMTYGFVLILLPSVLIHWRMMREQSA